MFIWDILFQIDLFWICFLLLRFPFYFDLGNNLGNIDLFWLQGLHLSVLFLLDFFFFFF